MRNTKVTQLDRHEMLPCTNKVIPKVLLAKNLACLSSVCSVLLKKKSPVLKKLEKKTKLTQDLRDAPDSSVDPFTVY